jgi:hypothetical protein
MTSPASDTPVQNYEISISIKIKPSVKMPDDLAKVENMLNSDTSVLRHLHAAIELSLINLQGLPLAKPGKNYEKADAFDMGPVKIERKDE